MRTSANTSSQTRTFRRVLLANNSQSSTNLLRPLSLNVPIKGQRTTAKLTKTVSKSNSNTLRHRYRNHPLAPRHMVSKFCEITPFSRPSPQNFSSICRKPTFFGQTIPVTEETSINTPNKSHPAARNPTPLSTNLVAHAPSSQATQLDVSIQANVMNNLEDGLCLI